MRDAPLSPGERPALKQGVSRTMSNGSVSRFLGGSPGAVLVKLLLVSLLVGVVLAWLGITPFGLWLGLRDFAHAIVANGFRGLHDIGRYILTGAAIVIPVWLVLRLLDSRRS